MAVKAISASEINSAKNREKHSQQLGRTGYNPNFQGLDTIPVAVANAINNGGFAFSFIAQDGFGMALPRVAEGINRRRVNPETGKKEGPYNWAFARREGIREILSGPSAFLIPWAILKVVKKYLGSANNVPVNMIQGLGANFINYSSRPDFNLKDVGKTKKEFYQNIFKNVLHTTLNGNLSADELNNIADDFTNRAIEIELAKDHKKSILQKIKGTKVPGSPEDLTDALLDDFMNLKKKYLSASVNELSADMTVNPEKIGKYGGQLTSTDTVSIAFKKLLKTLPDFTDDVIKSAGNALEKAKDGLKEGEIKEFLKSFVSKRSGSRIITNLGMWSAVVGFYALIPKLYSLGLGGKNPAFMCEAKDSDKKTTASGNTQAAGNKKNITFGSRYNLFSNASEKLLKSNKIKNFLSKFEFDDASMSVQSMMVLLFGFCLPARLMNAPDKYDFNETMTRDITSFSAILFAANAISRAFSDVFAKLSGLALNVKPDDHNKSWLKKLKNYFTPVGGVNVLNNKQLNSKYTNIDKYKDGINGFFDFVSENGGNLKKLLAMDNTVAENAKIIIGKDIKEASVDEIREAFSKNTSDETVIKAKEAIIKVFKDSKNIFVKRAKLYNSLFTFLSTLVLVPSFMIWLARKCDKMTRDARAKDLARSDEKLADEIKKIGLDKAAINVELARKNQRVYGSKPTMEGFLRK